MSSIRTKVTATFVIALFMLANSAFAFQLVPSDFYSSGNFSLTIKRYARDGTFIDNFVVPNSYGSEVRGLAFGPDGLLYAVTVAGLDFSVVTVDGTGSISSTYTGSGYIGGNISFGKIAFGGGGHFFVGGPLGLIAFAPGAPTGELIYSGLAVYDVKSLPSGNLLVISDYELHEITPAGAFVRAITPSIRLVNGRGVEYDPVSTDIFVTMLGFSGQFFQLMRLDSVGGTVKLQTTFIYGDDMFLTSDNRLVVGSRTQMPALFDLNLNQLGALDDGEQMFVTQMPALLAQPPIEVPSISRVAVLFLVTLIAFMPGTRRALTTRSTGPAGMGLLLGDRR